MDSSSPEASKKEDTSSSPSSSQPPAESPFLTYSKTLSPLGQPVKTYQDSFSSYCLLDELDPATLIYTPPRTASPSPSATLFESDANGGESLVQDPYDTKKVSEEPLLLSEEPKTVHQEKPSYVDEAGKIQDVECPFQECIEVESNLFADVVLEEHHYYHDSIAQVAVNEWQDHQDCTPQLMPEPLQNVEEYGDCGEMGPALHVSAENILRDDFEASQNHSVVRHCLQFEETASNFLGSDEIGGEILIEDPYYFNKWSEGPLLVSEEPKTVHQEKAAYVDEPGKIQDVEWPSQECREVESNLFADLVLEEQYCYDSIAQHEVNEWQNRQDCTPQLMPEPQQDVMECEDCGEMGPALHVSADNMSRDGCEANQKHSVVRRRLQFEEAASNSLGTVGSINLPLAALSPEDSISSVFSSVSKYLTASLMAMSSTSSKMKMNKLSEDSEPTTSLYIASVHDNNKLQPTSSGNSEEFNQPIPGKKMNTTPMTPDDGRRCTCKKSKCMKRLCGCFAAEFYCTEHCSCQGCLNRPEYQDEIDDIKQTIKSRKSHAFASKIVQNATDIPSNNTVKVGCSSWCRCQGCENSYGKEEDLHHNDVHAYGLSPLTPSLLCSDMSQLPLANVSQLTPLTNPASMYGASWDWTHILPHGSSYPLFGGPFRPHSSSMPITPMTRLGETTNLQCLESSNPVLFASNIVQDATDTPSNNTEDANLKRPSSPIWHKQGCACRKSKCLIKLSCDCYLYNAGCTSKCRCVGCENSYGKKGDHVAMEHALSKERESGRVEKASDAKFRDFDMSQPSVSLTNVSQSQVTPLTNIPASMSGASWDWTHTPHGSSFPLFGGPLCPQSSPMAPMTRLGETSNLQRLYDIVQDETHDTFNTVNQQRFSHPRTKLSSSLPPLTPGIHISNGKWYEEEEDLGDRPGE